MTAANKIAVAPSVKSMHTRFSGGPAIAQVEARKTHRARPLSKCVPRRPIHAPFSGMAVRIQRVLARVKPIDPTSTTMSSASTPSSSMEA